MKKHINLLFILLIIVVPQLIFAINRVDEIHFHGNNSISDKQLYKAINYNKKIKYSFDNLSKFKEQLSQFYKNNGYFDVKIDYELNKRRNKNIIVFGITEGEQYRIGNVDVQGNTVLSKNKIIKLMNLKLNSPAKIGKIKNGELNIGKYYSNLGYLYANVFTKINIIGKSAILLKIIIDEGQRVYVNSIDMKNLGKINRKIVSREIGLREGDPCSYGKLVESQSKIFGTGLFNDVHFTIRGIKEKKDSVDIIFYLNPSKTHWIFSGISYETPDIIAVNTEWGFNNLFNWNNWIKLNGKVAYSIKSGYLYRVKGYYLNPYFLLRELSLKISMDYYNKTYRDYIEKTKYLELSLGKQWLNNNFVSFNTNIQNSSYDSIVGGERKPLLIYYTNSAYIDINRDYTNNFVFPTNGFRYYAKCQYSGGILRGDNNFYKGYFSISAVKSYKKIIFSLKNQLGIIVPFNNTNAINISFDQKFKLGGAYNLRGYGENSLGVVDNYNNYGGLDLICTNFGITSPALYNFSLSAFFDAGVLSDVIGAIPDISDYKFDAGLGMRYITPIGPIRLDWAYPLDFSSRFGRIYLAIGTIY